jgi:uncharacterized membrane protein
MRRFVDRLRFWLFEEREHQYAENPKRRRQLNNVYLIQACAVLTGIVTFAVIPLIVWLVTLKSFVLVYIISSVLAAIAYASIGLYVRRLNKQYQLN